MARSLPKISLADSKDSQNSDENDQKDLETQYRCLVKFTWFFLSKYSD